MFEMTFPDGIKRGLICDGHKPVYVSKRGSQIMQGDWKQVRRAFDALPEDPLPEPGGKLRGAAGANLRSDLKAFVSKHGLHPEHHRQLLDLINELLSGEGRSDGAAAVDDMPTRHKVSTPSALDDDDGLQKFRSYLKAKGLGAEDVERAVQAFRRDAAARDRLPQNAIDLRNEYPGMPEVDVNYTGTRPTEIRPEPQFWNSGPDPIMRRPQDGVSRRLSNDAALASDEALEREYPGFSNCKVGMWR